MTKYDFPQTMKRTGRFKSTSTAYTPEEFAALAADIKKELLKSADSWLSQDKPEGEITEVTVEQLWAEMRLRARGVGDDDFPLLENFRGMI